MRINEVITYDTPVSPLGSDVRRFRTEVKGNGKEIIAAAYPKDEPDPDPVCKVRIEGTVLTHLKSVGKNDKEAKAALSEVLRALLKQTDTKGLDIRVHEDTLPDVDLKRFLERYGFLGAADNWMVRRNNSALPYHVI